MPIHNELEQLHYAQLNKKLLLDTHPYNNAKGPFQA